MYRVKGLLGHAVFGNNITVARIAGAVDGGHPIDAYVAYIQLMLFPVVLYRDIRRVRVIYDKGIIDLVRTAARLIHPRILIAVPVYPLYILSVIAFSLYVCSSERCRCGDPADFIQIIRDL